jgi:hypothetical protein
MRMGKLRKPLPACRKWAKMTIKLPQPGSGTSTAILLVGLKSYLQRSWA